MQVSVGMNAKEFEREDILGESISLDANRGHYVLLSFYRYAACPLSNLRIHELMANFDLLSLYGIALIGVFQSPAERIIETVLKQEVKFPLIADSEQELYRLYGVQSSTSGFFKGVAKRQSKFYEAIKQNKFLLGRIEGDYKTLPADILIDPDGIVVRVHYGEDIGDFMPLEDVLLGMKLKK
ncbi:MAG: redoxin domain-containing protein [Turicibacter sp.]